MKLKETLYGGREVCLETNTEKTKYTGMLISRD
jgi:hypothetical protein